jgi:hypothetical protein
MTSYLFVTQGFGLETQSFGCFVGFAMRGFRDHMKILLLRPLKVLLKSAVRDRQSFNFLVSVRQLSSQGGNLTFWMVFTRLLRRQITRREGAGNGNKSYQNKRVSLGKATDSGDNRV